MITIDGLEPTYSLFPNNEYNMTLSDSLVDKINGMQQLLNQVMIDWKFESTDDVFKLGMLLSAMEQTKADNVVIELGYLPYSRMDRHDENVVNPFSLEILINMLPVFNRTEYSRTTYIFNSIHNEEVVKTLMNKKIDKVGHELLSYFISVPYEIELAKSYLQESDKTIVVFPDSGSIKRYKKYVDFTDDGFFKFKNSKEKIPYVFGKKERDFETHKINGYNLYRENGSQFSHTNIYTNAIVIDDISSYGGTFIKIIDLLEKAKITDVNFAFGNVEDSIFKGDLLSKESLTSVYTTNGLVRERNNANVMIKNVYYWKEENKNET